MLLSIYVAPWIPTHNKWFLCSLFTLTIAKITNAWNHCYSFFFVNRCMLLKHDDNTTFAIFTIQGKLDDIFLSPLGKMSPHNIVAKITKSNSLSSYKVVWLPHEVQIRTKFVMYICTNNVWIKFPHLDVNI